MCSSCGAEYADPHAPGCPVEAERIHRELSQAASNRSAMAQRLAERAIAEAHYARTGLWTGQE